MGPAPVCAEECRERFQNQKIQWEPGKSPRVSQGPSQASILGFQEETRPQKESPILEILGRYNGPLVYCSGLHRTSSKPSSWARITLCALWVLPRDLLLGMG